MTIDVRDKLRVVLEQILNEIATTKLGDSREWRAARFDELERLGNSAAKIIDALEAIEQEADSGPYEIISQGIT
jgi:hypothetical protein